MITLKDYNVEFISTKLSNDIPVFYWYRKGVPACIRLSFFAGARFDQIPGTAHFLEHMLVAGTEKFPTKDKLAEHIERVGGGFSASTGFDLLNLNASVPLKEDFDIALDVLEQMLHHSIFEENTIINERKAIQNEISEDDNDPYYHLRIAVRRMMFKNTYLDNDVCGTVDSVEDINKNTLLQYRDKMLTSGNLSILISGDVNWGECTAKLEKIFGKIEKTERFKNPQPLPYSRENKFNSKPFRDNKFSYLTIIFPTVPMFKDHREEAAMVIIKDTLGSGRASRLSKELRYKRGLVYGCGASVNYSADYGSFSAGASFKKENLNAAMEVIRNEIGLIVKNGLDDEEIKFSKSAMIKSSFNNMQTSWSWVNGHMDSVFCRDQSFNIDEGLNLLDSITKEEILTAARKYLIPQNAHIAIAGVEEGLKIEF